MSIAPLGSDEEVGGALGAQTQMEIERECRGIKRRAEVGRGGWQRQAQRAIRRCGTRGIILKIFDF